MEDRKWVGFARGGDYWGSATKAAALDRAVRCDSRESPWSLKPDERIDKI